MDLSILNYSLQLYCKFKLQLLKKEVLKLEFS